VKQLDEVEGADELLSAHLLRVELGRSRRDEGEAVGDVGKAATIRETR
jgi:hypothetical protein